LNPRKWTWSGSFAGLSGSAPWNWGERDGTGFGGRKKGKEKTTENPPPFGKCNEWHIVQPVLNPLDVTLINGGGVLDGELLQQLKNRQRLIHLPVKVKRAP